MDVQKIKIQLIIKNRVQISDANQETTDTGWRLPGCVQSRTSHRNEPSINIYHWYANPDAASLQARNVTRVTVVRHPKIRPRARARSETRHFVDDFGRALIYSRRQNFTLISSKKNLLLFCTKFLKIYP